MVEESINYSNILNKTTELRKQLITIFQHT
uniref:Uncharacterized protein n=1 Tax=Anguilla anguilla TaxID=7936 RepID=A0A0E9V0W3_ANGAN